MSEMIDHVTKSTVEASGVEVYEMFQGQFSEILKINVPPEDREDAADVLRENGYDIGCYEELVDDIDGVRFTRIEAVLDVE